MKRTRAEAENRVLNRIVEVNFSSTDFSKSLMLASDLILEAASGDACFIYLLDDSQNVLMLSGATEPHREMVNRIQLVPGEGIAGWVLESQTAVVIADDKSSDPRYKPVAELGVEHLRSLISVPLVSPTERLKGAVTVHFQEPQDFSNEDVAFLEHVVSLVGASIEHTRLIQELESKELALQGIIQRTIQAQEEERRRVATDIHDGVTQQLISIWYRLNACERLLKRDVELATKELETAKDLVDEALDEARMAIYQLRPSTLDDLGLVPALDALASRTLGDTYDVSVAADIRSDIPNHLETALYRVAQEALNNIRKHAGPCRVEVTLESNVAGELVMRVIDDGRGFDLPAYRRARPETTFGLLGMSERIDLIGGRFSMRSSPADGTAIEVTLPLDRHPAGDSDAA